MATPLQHASTPPSPAPTRPRQSCAGLRLPGQQRGRPAGRPVPQCARPARRAAPRLRPGPRRASLLGARATGLGPKGGVGWAVDKQRLGGLSGGGGTGQGGRRPRCSPRAASCRPPSHPHPTLRPRRTSFPALPQQAESHALTPGGKAVVRRLPGAPERGEVACRGWGGAPGVAAQRRHVACAPSHPNHIPAAISPVAGGRHAGARGGRGYEGGHLLGHFCSGTPLALAGPRLPREPILRRCP